MSNKLLKTLLIIIIISVIGAFFIFDLGQYATLDYIKSKQSLLTNYYNDNTLLVLSFFGILYVIVTAFSLPIAAGLTLLGGALFGFIPALIIVSFASTIGASCAFLMVRFLLHDSIQKKYGKHLKKLNAGFKKEGTFYLFALRLVPIFPFFVVNILTALLPIRLSVFYIISQIGMLPGTAVYVFAGTEIGKINSLSDILSPTLLLAFALLGIFPIIAKKTLYLLRKKSIK